MTWRNVVLKQLAQVSVSNVDKKSVEGEIPVRLVNYTDVYYGDRLSPALALMQATATAEQVQTFRLRCGDVLLTKDSETAEDIGIAAYVDSASEEMVLGYHLSLLRPKTDLVDGHFLYWAMCGGGPRGQLAAGATGVTRFGLRESVIGSVVVAVPPIICQQQIARFLDAETARIDAVVAKTRSLAALLRERQLTNVFEAVTAGDWEGPLRESGLSWVDKLPAHWGAPWLGANYETQLGKMLDAEAAAGDKQAPYVRNVNVQWDGIDLANLASMSFSDSDRVRCELRGGDLLVCEGGEVGRAAVWPDNVKGIYFQKAIHRVRQLKDGNTRFLMYCLRAAAYLNVFAVEGNQSTIVHLTGEKLREHRFPYPPLDEQESIVRRLDEDRDRTKAMTDALQRQITLLQERRQALITAAVTGELKIPGVPA